ncbi:MAG: hypothetical protein DWP97_05670 [Calditrichaeota bacterium]|nr:MAG: hypothetical protein DWP97_05670 [Calditrichota bacterium]
MKMKESRIQRLYTCPCCGFPTLEERIVWDICSLCWWEDDGQDDNDADDVRGGPNYSYSLTVARDNFDKHFLMYNLNPDENEAVINSHFKKLEKKKEIIELLFQFMEGKGSSSTKPVKRWKEIKYLLDNFR